MKKFFIFLLLAFVIVMFSACSKGGSATGPAVSTPVPTSHQIYYTVTVTGNISLASVMYNEGIGDAFVSYPAAPYTSPTITFVAGDASPFVDATWTFVGNGSITVNIYKDGSLWKTSTSNSGACSLSGTL